MQKIKILKNEKNGLKLFYFIVSVSTKNKGEIKNSFIKL